MRNPPRPSRSLVRLALLALLISAPAAHAQLYPGLEGEPLLEAIRADYSPTQTIGYGPARDSLYSYEQRTDGEVCGVYTRYCITLTPGADPSVDAFEKGINAEHTWPQSFGAGEEPARSDLHNLFPARGNVNSSRGNLPLAEVPDEQATTWYRGSVSQSAIPIEAVEEWSERGTSAFEPREDHKGNSARALFYFRAIYSESLSASGQVFFDGMLVDHLSWSNLDPVDEAEQSRSVWIEGLQGTQNPFVLDSTLARRAFASEAVSVESAPEPVLDIVVYPNPTVGRVFVSVEHTGIVRLQVLDMLGRRVRAVEVEGRGVVDLDGLPPGVYSIAVEMGSILSRPVLVTLVK